MKKIIYSLLLSALLVGFLSCEDETSQDHSKITYYVNLEIQGDEVVTVELGDSYTDEGVIAMEGDNDITSSVVTTGSVNTSEVGRYVITYKATNQDGFSSSKSREIFVYDPSVTTDISGTYTLASSSTRVPAPGSTYKFVASSVTITQYLPGIFNCSDFLGGYYEFGVSYGSAYRMTGFFRLNPDNSLDILTGYVSAWGDNYDFMENGEYDPSTGNLYWELGYAGGYTFYVSLLK